MTKNMLVQFIYKNNILGRPAVLQSGYLQVYK